MWITLVLYFSSLLATSAKSQIKQVQNRSALVNSECQPISGIQSSKFDLTFATSSSFILDFSEENPHRTKENSA